jgi:putative beta-barrel porin BBP2
VLARALLSRLLFHRNVADISSGLSTLLKLRPLCACALVLVFAAAGAAQTPPPGDGGPDPATVRVRMGPLWMNPTVSMPNVGIDTNVFNEPLHLNPKRDFTITAAPKTEFWLRMGRTWLSGVVAEEIVWYQTYASERAANDTYTIGWKAPLNRVLMTTSATWLSTRSRPGFEIDARAARQEPQYSGSLELRGFAKTFLGVRGSWRQVRFDDAAVFKGSSLGDQLDRTGESAAITLRHELTPLTSITVSAGRSKERFTTALSRNSTTEDYSIALMFDPAALLKGNATIGYTVYKTESADLADYRGTTAAIALTYTLLGSTRFAGTITRDVEFSYDINQPYYVLTGGTLSIAQQVFGPFDVMARAGDRRLNYRSRAGAVVTNPDRTDRVQTYGGGFGIHLGPTLRLGFNLDNERRTSVLTDREYEGLKYGSSITYGL